MAEAEGRVTLWGIEVFLAAAEESAISAGARRLGVSPSLEVEVVVGAGVVTTLPGASSDCVSTTGAVTTGWATTAPPAAAVAAPGGATRSTWPSRMRTC